LKGILLETDLGDPYANVAFEEALLRAADVPTLRVWENQTSVIIGRAQKAEFETDLEYCREHSVPVVRRITAGGAVYNGPGNVNWSYVIPRNDGLTSFGDARQAFMSCAQFVMGALRICGVESEFSPPNALVDGQGKISGMAAYVSSRAVLCHGTLLVDADLVEVQRLTEPKKEKLHRRYPRSRFTEVSNCGVEKARFVNALAESGGVFDPGVPTKKEEEVFQRILSLYRSPEWNLGNPFP
jgi:lipoate-protein ligase A